MKKNVFTFFILLCSSFLSAKATVPDGAIDISQNKIYIQNGGYSVASSSGTLISHTSNYDIYSSKDTASNMIYIQDGAGEQEINLWNLTNNYSSGIIYDKSTSDISLKINGCCTILGTTRSIGFSQNVKHKMDITGDSLILQSSILGTVVLNNIELDFGLKYVNFTSGGIGLSYRHIGCVSIKDSCIFTSSDIIYADSIVIGKASVKVNGMSSTTYNAKGDTVYCVTVPSNGGYSVTVKNTATEATEEYSFTSAHPDDSNYYLYLPNGSYELTSNGTTYSAIVAGAAVTASVPAIVGDGVIDVSQGEVTINDSTYQIGTQPYTYTGRKFTLSGTATSWGVTVNGGADTLVLNNVNIQYDLGCALNLNSDTDMVVILKDGTSDTLVSGDGKAGLQKSQTQGLLTIEGNGTLTATGGVGGGAGIGSASGSACSNIILKSGIITASGANNNTLAGANFGAGYNGRASNLTIAGGTLYFPMEAYCDEVCIGSYNGNNDSICITGGIINIEQVGAGYKSWSYVFPSNLHISGGTISVTPFIQGRACYYFGTKNRIIGGSLAIKETSIKNVENALADAVGETSYIHPVGSDTATTVYRSRFQLPGITEPTAIKAITINDSIHWGCNDVSTDSTGFVHLWLPISSTDTVVIKTADKSYVYAGEIVNYDDYVAADLVNDIPEYGNYWWQVPVSIEEPEHGTLTVKHGTNTLSDGSYVCSRSTVTAEATPNTGYSLDSIMVNDVKVTTPVSVTASDSLVFAAAFSPQYFTVSYATEGSGTLSITSENSTIETGTSIAYGTELNISAVAAQDFRFDSLVVNGIATTKADTTLTVTGKLSIEAYFTSSSGISSAEINQVSIYTADNRIVVNAAEGDKVVIYTLDGQTLTETVLTQAKQAFMINDTGIYLVKVSNNTGSLIRKCVIK